MQVSVENTGSLGRRMTVAVPAERFEREFSVRLRRLSQNVKIPGFRPGKVPLKMIEAQYGGKLLQEVASDLIQTTFYEATGEQGLRPAGGPRIEPKSLERGRDFEYIATFEVYPEVGEVRMPTVGIERAVCNITDTDIDRTLETMRKQRMTWTPIDRPAQLGDKIEMDFVGSVAGTAFEGGEAHDFPYVLGSNALIEGFESGLIGAGIGEARTVNVEFPSDYRNTQLAGQKAQFAVTVKKIFAPVLPEIDAAFLQQLGVEGGTVEALRADVRKSLEQEAKDRTQAVLKRNVFNALMAANPIEVPQGLIDSEAKRLVRMARSNWEAQRLPPDKFSEDSSPYKAQARERVLLGLILAELVKVRDIKVDATKVRSRIEELAKGYESPQEFIKWHYSNPERLGEIESLLLEEEALNVVMRESKLEDKPIDFQTLVQSR